jgi:MoaA/NifB/PqqE/SkfB family radical SAM enzyme
MQDIDEYQCLMGWQRLVDKGLKMNMRKIQDLFQQARIAAGILNRKVYTGPWHVQIDLTNQCNNDCIACWCNSPFISDKGMDPDTRKKFLSRETMFRLIDELDEMGVRKIYFTGGGEPFMHPEILDFMRRIKNRRIHLDMSTNFTLVDRAIARQLVDIGIDHMNLSLWAATPGTYAVQHPNKTPETFLQMFEIMNYINELKGRRGVMAPALGMYNVINRENYFEIAGMLEYAYAHKLDDISFVPVDTVPDCTDTIGLTEDHLTFMVQQIKKFPQMVEKLRHRYNHDVDISHIETFASRLQSSAAENAQYDGNLLQTMPSCYAGWYFARILANGDVNSCLKSFKIPVGNIHEKSFKAIWFGKKQQEFRQHTIDYDINDPYFLRMGNDRMTEEQGCVKCCDNLGLNMSVHEKLEQLTLWKKIVLKGYFLF